MPGSQKPERVAASPDRVWGAADGPKAVFGGVWQGLHDAESQSHLPRAPVHQIHPFQQAGPLRPARWAGWGVSQYSARMRGPGHPEISRESLPLKEGHLCSVLFYTLGFC